MDKDKAWEICLEIYRRQFKKSNPSVDFDKLKKEGVTSKKGWFMRYYLCQDRQQEIIDEVCKERKVDNFWKRKIEEEVNLGCSPNTSEKTWKEEMIRLSELKRGKK